MFVICKQIEGELIANLLFFLKRKFYKLPIKVYSPSLPAEAY